MSYQLYKVSQELLAIQNQLEELEGDISENEGMLDYFNVKKEELQEKSLDIINLIKSIELELVGANEELARINAFIRKKETSVEKMQDFLLAIVQLHGEENKNGNKKLVVGTHTLSVKKSEAVDIEEGKEADIPSEYKKATLTLKNLSIENLGKVKDLLEKETESGLNLIEKAETVVPVKADIKEALKLQEAKLDELNIKFKSGQINQDEYDFEINLIPDIHANMKTNYKLNIK